MLEQRVPSWPAGLGPRVRVIGISVAAASAVALILGLILVGLVAGDLRSSLQVTRSATLAIGETIVFVDGVAAETATSLDAAADGVGSTAATVRGAVTALESLTGFLEEDLPRELETVRDALPGAIQAAGAIDTTLRALSLVGVDYDPEEPLAESLRDIDSALDALPDELRRQSLTIRALIPTANELGENTDRLADALAGLSSSLGNFAGLTESYRATLTEAEMALGDTDSSLQASTWLLRGLIVLMGSVGIAVGLALASLAEAIEEASVHELIIPEQAPR